MTHHKKVELPNIQFGPNLDVRHPNPFWYSVTSKLNQLTSNFKKYGCQTSSMIFGIGCPHSLEMELDVQFKTFQKWMSDILDVTFRKWMSAISKMDVTHFKNECHTFWMSHVENGCQTFWMSHFENGCQTFQKWMSESHFKNGCQTFQKWIKMDD